MTEPDLFLVVKTFADAGADFVLVGGFAVVAHDVLRTTEDSDLLIPDDSANDSRVLKAVLALNCTERGGQTINAQLMAAKDNLHLESPTAGRIDLLRGGLPPLDFESVSASAMHGELNEVPLKVAGLSSLVAFKRLAGRPQDLADLAKLEEIHGPLPDPS
ncbi:MAG: hypothetical protein WCJ63_05900 [Actinomycetes bacterium]